MNQSPLWFLLLLTLIPAIAGVAGAALGQAMAGRAAARALDAERRRELDRWSREDVLKEQERAAMLAESVSVAKRSLYVDYLLSLENFHRILEVARLKMLAGSALDEQLAVDVEAALQDSLRASLRLDLLAPATIVLATFQSNVLAAQHHYVIAYDFDPKRADFHRRQHTDEFPRLVAAMRNDLGLTDSLDPWLRRMSETYGPPDRSN